MCLVFACIFSSVYSAEEVTFFDPISDLPDSGHKDSLLEAYRLTSVSSKQALQAINAVSFDSNLSTIELFIIEKIYCDAYAHQGETVKLEQRLSKLRLLAKEQGFAWINAYVEYYSGIVLSYNGEESEAVNRFKQAIEISRANSIFVLLGEALNELANTETALGNSHNAIEHFLTAIKIFEALRSESALASVYNNLTTLYIRVEDYDKALQYSAKTEVYNKKFKNQRRLAITLVNRSFIYSETNQPEKELESILEAKVIADELDTPTLKLGVGVNLSDTYLKLQRYKEAKTTAMSAIELANNTKNQYMGTVALTNLGMAKVKLGDAKSGIKDMENALETFKTLKLVPNIVGTYVMLAEAHEFVGNFEQSLIWYKKYHKAHDEMQVNARQEKVLALQEKFEANQKAQEIELLKRENQLAEEQVKSQAYQRNVSIAFTFMGLAIAVLLFNRYRLLFKLNKSLKRSNQALYDKSHKDPLTGALNRRFISDDFLVKLNQSDEESSESYYTLAVIDIDHFKNVNDTYGHDFGDHVLIEFTRRLKDQLRESDLVVRWGGEEFLVLSTSNQPGTSKVLIQRLLEAIRETKFVVGETSIDVTASIGFTSIVGKQELYSRWSEFLLNADTAVYAAKSSGRDQAKESLIKDGQWQVE